MPNWVRNKLEFIGRGDKRKLVSASMTAEDGSVTFDKIVTMPPCLREMPSPQYTEEDKAKASEYREKYGASDWYEWSMKNWGCKWDASNGVINSVGAQFETPWSFPHEFLTRASDLYPEVKFRLMFADEDFGFNCGVVEFKGGDNVYAHAPNGGSEEAYGLAFAVWGFSDGDIEEMLCRFGEDSLFIDLAVAYAKAYRKNGSHWKELRDILKVR